MPTRGAKKVAGPGKRGGRTRGTPKAAPANPEPEAALGREEPVKRAEAAPDEVKEKQAVKVSEVKEKVVAGERKKIEEKPKEANGVDSSKKENNNVKDSVEEYEKGERLELEDNDPEEYEPEEYGGVVDYDEKGIAQEDEEEEVDDDMEEEAEDGDVDEDEGSDVPEEEMEDPQEELEPEEEEHAEMVNVEEQEHTDTVNAEELEHHEVFKERRKRKEFEIFVGGLDRGATEEDLRKVFGEVGEVTEVRLIVKSQSKKNKGFAFLRFATVEQAKRACSELKNPVVNGKQCGVSPSQDSDTLFVGNICKTWTKEALKEKLKHYGINTVEDLTLVEDSKTDGTNRGFAFLEFSSRSAAMDAFKRLQKRDVMFGVDRPAKVSFADSFVDPGDEIMAQVKTVFVDGLPASWDEDRVRQIVKIYGEVEKVELARNMPSAKRKDFGFITFGTHDAAVTCAKSINNEELGEGENKARVRARLSRPLQKGRGKNVSRGDFRPDRAVRGSVRGPRARAVPRSLPPSPRGIKRFGARRPPVVDRGVKRPVDYRERRPVMALPPRRRPVAPLSRSDRRPPVPPHPKSSLKRGYERRVKLPPRSRAAAVELPPRSRAAAEYGPPRSVSERHLSYRDDYPSRGSAYTDLPRGFTRPLPRQDYPDDGYGPRFERPPPSYHEGRPRDYDSVSGSKRPFTALDDIPPRYADTGLRQSRARLDYEMGGGASHGDGYSDRPGRSSVGYGSGRSSISAQDSHGLYSSRQGMAYGGASYSGNDVGEIYPSSFGDDYMSRGGDVRGSSYSSMYSAGRSVGSSSSRYTDGRASGSYY